MTVRFRVEITGQQAILESLRPHLQAHELRLETDGDTIYLTSSTFDNLNSRDEVFEQAQRMIPAVRAAARIVGLRPGPIDARRVEEQTADGPRSTMFVQVGTATATITALPPTILIGGNPPPPPPPIPVEIALRDDRVARALELFAGDPNWYDLYKVLDVIEDDLGGYKAVERAEWASTSELNRFTATANSLAALGGQARHARDKWKAPKTPMPLDDAVELIRRLLLGWLATK